MKSTTKRITKRRQNHTDSVDSKPASVYPSILYGKILKNVTYLLVSILVCIFSLIHLSRISITSQSNNELIYNITCQNTKSVDFFPSCSPPKCARIVVHDFLSLHQVSQLIQLVNKALNHGRSLGGASIFDLYSGAISNGDKFINVYSIHTATPVFHITDFELVQEVIDKVHSLISAYFGIEFDNVFLTHPTFFSEITAKPAYTVHDEYWHNHVDKETYEGFEYTSLLYLSEQDKDFTGGSFFYENNGKEPGLNIHPRPGLLSIFTSGKENPHRVEKIREGVRYALTIGFTCDPNRRIKIPTHQFRT